MNQTKLLSSNPDRLDLLFESEQFSEVLSPVVQPQAIIDEQQIDHLLIQIGCHSNRPASLSKLRTLMSSFLVQAQRLANRVQRKSGQMVIGWPHDEAYWRTRSEVGYKISIALREALLESGWITHHKQATINLYHGESNCNGYLIADFVPELAHGIAFQSSELTYPTKSSARETKGKKVTNEALDKRTTALWELWKSEPLTLGDLKMWRATRSFSNKELTRGGRFFGPWTSMNKERERLKCTIGGSAVAEVDVSGMYPTLLCAITGHVPFKTRFKDPYFIEGIEREEVKTVLKSAIGGGTANQKTLTDLMRKSGLTQKRLTEIRRVILPKFGFLRSLKKGVLDSEALAYHETEILMRVIERLNKPIFILHDCLICKAEEALEVGKEMQKEFVQYCVENNWRPISPAFTIERDGKDKQQVSGERSPFYKH
jgi:hypothetical protein